MANEEQLALLTRTGHEWNQWRIRNADATIDLTNANLRRAILGGYNLEGADFRGTDLGGASLSSARLQRANLTDVHLEGANLESANLTNAILKRANLSGVRLKETNLQGANLQGAILKSTYIRGANLNGANFTDADLRETIFSNASLMGMTVTNALLWMTQWNDVDLSYINGLSTVRHLGPSTIGNDTFYASHGDIPDAFLRGCGVSDALIEFVHTIAQTLNYSCVFLSYGPEDELFGTRLYDDLQASGIRCWKYPLDLKVGGKVYLNRNDVIRTNQKLVIVISEAETQSEWLPAEIKTALNYEEQEQIGILVPITLDIALFHEDAEWAYRLRERHTILDFTGWDQQYQSIFNSLLHELQSIPAPE